LIPSLSMDNVSILARLLPTSRCFASATRSCILGEGSSLLRRDFFNNKIPL
jgi:hypothetical protein